MRAVPVRAWCLALASCLTGMQAGRVCGAAQAASKVGELRGVWMTPEGEPTWNDTMQALARHNLNAAFPYVATAGVAYYRSQVLPLSPSVAQEGDALRQAIVAGRRYGIQVHARVLALFAYLAPQATLRQYAAQDRYMRDDRGRVVNRWLCPSKHVNRQQLASVAAELAAGYDVDGIQLDYLRYPSSTTCYCPSCKFSFERDLRLKVPHWPQDVLSGGPLRMDYLAWRQANLTRLLSEVREAVRETRPGVLVSAAVFPNWASHRYTYGQDWRTWVQMGLLDFVCPMDYVQSRARLAEWSARQVQWVDCEVPVCTGLGAILDHAKLTPDALIGQIEASRETGADGFVIFRYDEELAQRYLPALSGGVTAEPASSNCLSAAVRVQVPAVETLGGERTALAADPLDVHVTIAPGVTASGELRVYSAAGDLVQRVGMVDSARGRAFRASVSVAPGAYRAVFTGNADGRLVAAWGPLVRVMDGDALSALRRKYRLPHEAETRIRVAILADGRGTDPMYDVLAGDESLYPFVVDAPTDEVLQATDVLVVPELSGGAYALAADRVAAIRQWVNDGGGLLMTHDAVGFGGFPAIVPAVCEQGAARVQSTRCVLTAVHPIFEGIAKGSVLRHGYGDHVSLQPGPNGREVLADRGSAAGAPVLLAGHYGHGLAVACGILLGVGPDGAQTALSADERTVLVGSVRWLGSQRRSGA